MYMFHVGMLVSYCARITACENRFKINVWDIQEPLVDAYAASRKIYLHQTIKKCGQLEDTQMHKCSSFQHSHVGKSSTLCALLMISPWGCGRREARLHLFTKG